MEIRKFNSQNDYETVANWWKAYEWPVVPLDLLPKTGFVVDDAAAGWLYKTDSKFAWIEWVVGNPAYDKQKRGDALDILILKLTETAKADGFTTILTSTNNKRLCDRYEKHGFMATDKDMTNLIARIA